MAIRSAGTAAGEDGSTATAPVARVAVAGALALAAAIHLLDRPPLLIAALLATCLLLDGWKTSAATTTATAVGLALVGVEVVGLAASYFGSLNRPPEFDFAAFWWHARLAARGVDFYDPERIHAALSAAGASPMFIALGRFWYPPQTMLLFLPLGWIADPRLAWPVWSALLAAAALATVVLLAKVTAAPPGRPPYLLAAAAVAALPATTTTFHHGQTHFLVLVPLLLSVLLRQRARRPALGGMALGLAAIVKPIALIAALEPLVRRRQRELAGLAFMAAASTAIALLVFGFRLFAGYMARGAGPIPRELYSLSVNESLLGLLVRRGWVGADANPVTSPIYLVTAGSIVALATWIVIRRRSGAPALDVAFLLAVGLVVYPQALDHYAVLLLPAIVLLARRSEIEARLAAAAAPLLGALALDPGVAPSALVAALLCGGVAGSILWRSDPAGSRLQ